MTTPNVNSWERALRGDSWSGAMDPQHRILFTTYSLSFLVQKLGFTVQHLSASILKLDSWGILHPNIGAQYDCGRNNKPRQLGKWRGVG